MQKYILLSLLSFTFISVFSIFSAEKYVMINEANFMQPCSKEDDKGNSKFSDYFDMSGLFSILSEDLETRYTSGKIVVIGSLPQGYPIRMDAEVYAWSQNKWINTVFTLRSDNICGDLMNQPIIKFWFDDKPLTNMQQECSPRKGTIFTVQNATNRMELPDMFNKFRYNKAKIVMHLSVAWLT